jgi:hypothetical protein
MFRKPFKREIPIRPCGNVQKIPLISHAVVTMFRVIRVCVCVSVCVCVCVSAYVCLRMYVCVCMSACEFFDAGRRFV